MRFLLVLLLLSGPVIAQGAPTYSCLGLTFQLPVAFTSPQQSAMFQAFELYYPAGSPMNFNYKLALATLPADHAQSKTEWFNLAYQALISMRGLAPTGAQRTFLGQAVPEMGGEIRGAFTQGQSLAYLVPQPDGGYLFIGLEGVRDYTPADMQKVMDMLSSSLQLSAPPNH